VSELAQWNDSPQRCLIVENKLTFLTLPPLPNTLALWGGGFRVSLLKSLTWLSTRTLFYWGDLDAHGFQILSQLRHLFPRVVSVLMDRTALERFTAYVVPGTLTSVLELPHLLPEEQQVYQQVQQSNLRLEQERIEPGYAKHRLESLLT
jgi:hypothetical protein